ncbi:unnamed protein product [Didymodactylos carnosus]|uniref:Uncharacterized protein n=1 Tax=Didymodactylos carnosus TaxID=1234261 RepID=A0A814QAE1_9BILA|nr:unnamed protein product [Didymodactylos carnosus]CAF1469991.1 unnamed protein product [Didymodactylos carnosus]CAF3881414.1 unnamed protein product [Didymodactylos carnosus]CAF4262113.1 unnamed protein product [Didymodactylos carnosus]
MRTGIILFFCLVLIAIVHGNKRMSLGDDDDFDNNMELSVAEARSFLEERGFDNSDSSDDDDNTVSIADSLKRAQGDCVRCKGKIAMCCWPNFCKKHFIRLNECVEVKVRR